MTGPRHGWRGADDDSDDRSDARSDDRSGDAGRPPEEHPVPGWSPPAARPRPAPYPAPHPPAQRPPYGAPYQPSPHGQPGYGPPSQGQGYAPPGYGPAPYAPPGHGPHPYGPPPWQPPDMQAPPGWAPPPARRSRAPRVVALVLLGLLVVVAAVAVPLATRGTALDPRDVQRDVAAQYQQLHGGTVDLRCDQEMTVEPGRSYRCAGSSDDQGDVAITIRITGADGAYTWSDGS